MRRRKPLSFFVRGRAGRIKAEALAVALLAGAAVFASCDVRVVPTDSIAWQTLHAASVTLPVDYPDGAARATVTAVNMEGRRTVLEVPFGADSAVWTPFAGAAPAADDVYDLTLEFYKEGADAPFTNRTARVAVVKGAFGDAVNVNLEPFVSAWPLSPRSPVFAYSPVWAADMAADASVTGLVVTVSTAAGPVVAATNAAMGVSSEGWFASRLPLAEGADFTVSLSTLPGEESLAVERMSVDLRIAHDGTVLTFR